MLCFLLHCISGLDTGYASESTRSEQLADTNTVQGSRTNTGFSLQTLFPEGILEGSLAIPSADGDGDLPTGVVIGLTQFTNGFQSLEMCSSLL